MRLTRFLKAAQNDYRRWRNRRVWERQWRKPNFRPRWLADTPRPFVISGFENGWFAPHMTVLEIGCGLGTAARGSHSMGFRL